MRLAFTSMSSTKGLKIVFDTERKDYIWLYGLVDLPVLYMPTNKDLLHLEKELIKNGYTEVE